MFQWSGGIIEFQWQGHLQSQWISSQAIHEAIQTRKKRKSTSLSHKKPTQIRVWWTWFYHSPKIFVTFVIFQVFSILLILVFDLKSCFYVCFNLFEWSQVEEIMKKLKGRNRSEIGAKTEQKQGSVRLCSLRKSSAKLALCCQTISQLIWLLCENFRSCEAKFGTRVPLRSTGAPNSQLRNGYEAIKRENPWFRNQSSIP